MLLEPSRHMLASFSVPLQLNFFEMSEEKSLNFLEEIVAELFRSDARAAAVAEASR